MQARAEQLEKLKPKGPLLGSFTDLSRISDAFSGVSSSSQAKPKGNTSPGGAHFTLLKNALRPNPHRSADMALSSGTVSISPTGQQQAHDVANARKQIEDAIHGDELVHRGAGQAVARSLAKKSYSTSRPRTPAEAASAKPLQSFGGIGTMCVHCKKRNARYKSLNTGEKLC